MALDKAMLNAAGKVILTPDGKAARDCDCCGGLPYPCLELNDSSVGAPRFTWEAGIEIDGVTPGPSGAPIAEPNRCDSAACNDIPLSAIHPYDPIGLSPGTPPQWGWKKKYPIDCAFCSGWDLNGGQTGAHNVGCTYWLAADARCQGSTVLLRCSLALTSNSTYPNVVQVFGGTSFEWILRWQLSFSSTPTPFTTGVEYTLPFLSYATNSTDGSQCVPSVYLGSSARVTWSEP